MQCCNYYTQFIINKMSISDWRPKGIIIIASQIIIN